MKIEMLNDVIFCKLLYWIERKRYVKALTSYFEPEKDDYFDDTLYKIVREIEMRRDEKKCITKK